MLGDHVPLSGAEFDARWKNDAMRRIADLERVAQRSTSCGFHLTRGSNAAAVADGAQSDIILDHVVAATWSTLTSFTSGSAITVPGDAAGLYVLTAGVYWAVVTFGIFVAVTVNNLSAAPAPTPIAATDRTYCSSTARLNGGDVVRLHVTNVSGAVGPSTAITPTFYPGDINTAPVPFVQAWRIST